MKDKFKIKIRDKNLNSSIFDIVSTRVNTEMTEVWSVNIFVYTIIVKLFNGV